MIEIQYVVQKVWFFGCAIYNEIVSNTKCIPTCTVAVQYSIQYMSTITTRAMYTWLYRFSVCTMYVYRPTLSCVVMQCGSADTCALASDFDHMQRLKYAIICMQKIKQDYKSIIWCKNYDEIISGFWDMNFLTYAVEKSSREGEGKTHLIIIKT